MAPLFNYNVLYSTFDYTIVYNKLEIYEAAVIKD